MLRIFGTPSLPAAGTKVSPGYILLYLEDPWRVQTPSGIDTVVKRNRLGQIKILALATSMAVRPLEGPRVGPRHRQRPSVINNEVKRNLSNGDFICN